MRNLLNSRKKGICLIGHNYDLLSLRLSLTEKKKKKEVCDYQKMIFKYVQ